MKLKKQSDYFQDISPDIHWHQLDLMNLSHYYNLQNIKDYLSTRKSKELSFENNEKLEIICIPPWEIEKIKVEIDHFHNTASFVEMPESVVKNYVKYLISIFPVPN